MLDLEVVASFLALAQEQSYGRAAARLHLNASTLSRRVQHLERTIGTRLVERGPGGVERLTSAGERFVLAAPALLAHAQDVQRATVTEPVTTVRVGLPGAVGDYPTRLLLRRLRRRLVERRPDLRLRFLGVPLPLLDESLSSGQVDVVWTIEHDAPGQHQTRLGRVERVGLVAATHELAAAHRTDGRRFAELPLLRAPAVDRGWMAPWLLADVRPVRDAQLVDIDASGVSDVVRAVALGRAVTVVHAPQAMRLPAAVRVVQLDHVGDVSYVATRRARDPRPEVADVIEAMKEIAVVHPVAAPA